jgi:DNA helicase HerA-like ATPase
MKTKLRLLMVTIGIVLLHIASFADNEDRKLPVFTEISLRIPGKLYIQQGDVQKVTIDAKSSTLNDIITEVNGRALIIRFPAKNYLWKTFDPGSIIIHVTIPEISGLNVSLAKGLFLL